jgi:Inorganic Pyrophosphatase
MPRDWFTESSPSVSRQPRDWFTDDSSNFGKIPSSTTPQKQAEDNGVPYLPDITMQETGTDLVRGLATIPSLVTGGLQWATSGHTNDEGILGSVNRGYGKASDIFNNIQLAAQKSKTAETQREYNEEFLPSGDGIFGVDWQKAQIPNWEQISSTIVQSAAPGGLIGKGGSLLTKVAEKVIPKLSPTAAKVVGYGGANAAFVSTQTYDDTFRSLYEEYSKEYPEEQARELAAKGAARAAELMAGVSSITGGVSGVASGATGNLPARMIKGAAIEAVPEGIEEGIQSAAPQIATGKDIDMRQALISSALGMASGVGQGAVFAGMEGGGNSKKSSESDVLSDADAARIMQELLAKQRGDEQSNAIPLLPSPDASVLYGDTQGNVSPLDPQTMDAEAAARQLQDMIRKREIGLTPDVERVAQAQSQREMSQQEAEQLLQTQAAKAPLALPAPDTKLYGDTQGNVASPEAALLENLRKNQLAKEENARKEQLGLTPDVEAAALKQQEREAKMAEDIKTAASEVSTEPTDAQKEAGNYKKGHVNIQGLDVTIENPQGSERSGTDTNGKPWSSTMPAHYGYVKGTQGADGEHVDVYVGNKPASKKVWVIDQKSAETGNFDEHKSFVGYESKEDVIKDYDAAFSDGKGAVRRGDAVHEMTMSEFKKWLKKPQKKPIAKIENGLKQPRPITNTTKTGKPRSLFSFIRAHGGITPTDESKAELGKMDLGKHMAGGGLLSSKKGGKQLDMMREAAVEQGYLPEDTTVADFLNLIDKEARGKKVYTPEQTPTDEKEDVGEKEYYIHSRAADYGIPTEGRTLEDIEADVAEADAANIDAAEAEEYGDAWEGNIDNVISTEFTDEDIPFDLGEFYGQQTEAQAQPETGKDAAPTGEQSQADTGKEEESPSTVENTKGGGENAAESAGEKVESPFTGDVRAKVLTMSYEDLQQLAFHMGIKLTPNLRANHAALVDKVEEYPASDIIAAAKEAQEARQNELQNSNQDIEKGEYVIRDRNTMKSISTFFPKNRTHLNEVISKLKPEYEAVPYGKYAGDMNKLIAGGDTRFNNQTSTTAIPQDTQTVIKGAERISDKQLAERKMEGRKGTDKPQKSAGSDGGLFDTEARNEQDLFSQPTSPVKSQSNPKPQEFNAYHGTASEFEKPSLNTPYKKDSGWLGKGFYAYTSSAGANLHANNMKGKGNAYPNVRPVKVSLKNPYNVTLEEKEQVRFGGEEAAKAFTDKLEAAGHDGAILELPDGSKEIVVFDVDAVKTRVGKDDNEKVYSLGTTEKWEGSKDKIKQRVYDIIKQINPDVKARVVDELFGEGEAVKASGGDTTERQPVAGSYSAAKNLIEVALNRGNPEGTAFHEAWHSIEKFLSEGELQILKKAFPGEEGVTHDEQTAYAFEQWALRKKQDQLPAVKRIFAKVRTFLKQLGNMLRGNGFKSVESIFTDASKGKMAKREAKNETAEDNDPEDARIQYSTGKVQAVSKEKAKEASGKVARYWKRNFTKEGYLNKPTFDLKIESDNMKNVDNLDIGWLASDFEKAVSKAYDKPYSKISDAQKLLLREYLAGEDVKIPESVKESVAAMRGFIDATSGRLQKAMGELIEMRLSNLDGKQRQAAEDFLATGGQSGALPEDVKNQLEMLQKIEGNKGSYLNRSYQAFDDPKWMDKVLKDRKIMEDAKAFIAEQNPRLNEKEVEGAVRAILRSAQEKTDMVSLLSGGTKVGKKDVSFLKKRKDVPPQIRSLLGEYVDPKVSFLRSATKMSNYLAGHYFLTNLRKEGLGTFLFENPTGEFDTKVAADGSDTMNPLNGLYTTKDFVTGLEDATGKGGNEPEWLKKWIAFNSAVKYGKTILAPTTQVRNFYSAMFFPIANGHFDFTKTINAFHASKADLFTDDKKWRGYIKELVELGVLHDNPNSQELREAIDDVVKSGALKGNGGVKGFLDLFQKMYRTGDDFWKMTGFENEVDLLVKHKGLTREKAKIEAAKHIRNHYPTYSLVPRGIRGLRRFPLAGTFVSFPWEILRTTKNMASTIVQDYQDGHKALAAQRALGFAVAGAASFAVSQLTMMMMGISDDDDEAIHKIAPTWQKNADFAYAGYDEDGLPRYYDISYLDPYAYLKKPLHALFTNSGDDIAHKIKDAIAEVAVPFIGPDITAANVGEIIFNQKLNGGRVYNPQDDVDEQAKDILKHLKNLAPGVVGNLERSYKALSGDISKSGKRYDVGDEAMAWVGFRVTTMNVPESMVYKGYEFQDNKADSTKILSSVAGSAERITPSEIDAAFENMISARQRSYKNIIKVVKAAESLGIKKPNIYASLKASGISEQDIGYVMAGKIPDWTPSKQFLQAARQRAMQSAPSAERKREVNAEFRTRIMRINELVRQQNAKNRLENQKNNVTIPLSLIKEQNPELYPLMQKVKLSPEKVQEILNGQ